MLEIGRIREEKNIVKEGLIKKGISEEKLCILDEILDLDDKRKKYQTQIDNALNESKSLANTIGSLYKEQKMSEANDLKESVASLKTTIQKMEVEHSDIVHLLETKLISLPNIPHLSVPYGKTAEDNFIFKNWEKALPEMENSALPHWELAEKYDIISFKDGVKITGAGFPLFKNKGARLQRALINFFLDSARDAGYDEYMPPIVVNEESARATGQLPDKEGQMYHCEKDNLFLIPTAEVPLTNIYRQTILKEEDFPIKLCGYTPCFRREAGSYGSDVKGLNRVHQFEKVEIVQIQHPSNSYEALMDMVNHVEGLLNKLELPYRILRLCGGDMSFNSALTYDFETYSAAQKKWLEVSSVSNFETFQSNRMKLRFKDANGKTQLAHTLNGSALALARIVATILENHQTPHGIKIPQALVPYTGFEFID